MNLKNKEKSKIREKILTEKYGRFLFVEKIIKEEEILKLPPRILLAEIEKILSIDLALISTEAFGKWHRRYKKTHRAKKDKIEQIAPPVETNTNADEPDTWLDWKPSDEALKRAGTLPLFIKPITK